MRMITRTVYGSALQNALLLGRPHEILANTTLNEKFEIQEQERPENTPTVGYFCIGNKGHQVITGSDGGSYTGAMPHRAKDSALYQHIPFVVREPDKDLTTQERSRYALRKKIYPNGEEYIAYYLRRMDLSSVAIDMIREEVIDGVENSSPYVPSSDALSPQQPELPNSGVITSDGVYLSTSAIVPVRFTQADVQELIHVAEVLYGTAQRAIISEIGLCSGEDLIVREQDHNGDAFNYNEAVGVQIVCHVTGYYPMSFANNGLSVNVQAGATEPMLGEGVRQNEG